MTQERFRYQKPAEEDTTEQHTPRTPRTARASQEQGTYTEELIVSGNRLVGRVVQLLREGNALSITVKDPTDRVLFEVPMSVGVVGTVLFPSVTGLVVLGSLFADLKIVVERKV